MAKEKKTSVALAKSETIGSSSIVRPLSSVEKGQPRIATSSRFIQASRLTELKMPNRLCTFDNMAADDSVWTSIDSTNVQVLIAMLGGEFIEGPSGSTVSKEAAAFLNYNIRNMKSGTWVEAINSACTDIKYGFALQNIVMGKRTSGQYKGMWCLDKLSPRSQKSVYGWVWDKNFREVLGYVQKPMQRKSRQPTTEQFERGLFANDQMITQFKYPYLTKEQLLWFRYNPTDNDPEGDSPLMHCYDAWMEKKLVERYEIIGVTKDLGGLLVLRVHPELIEKANDPDLYPDEAAEYASLQEDAAKLHAGESSFILLSSKADDITKKYDFDIDLKGVDGGGKQYNTGDIIDQKRKSIYNVFGASHIVLGQDGGGSYSLSSSKVSINELYVNRNILFKTDVINNQLIPTILKANNIKLDWKDMPTFRHKEASSLDLDEFSKVVMRLGSVMKLTPDVLTELCRIANLPTTGIDLLDFTDKGDNRGGESKGSSGTGGTQSNTASSSTNGENGGTAKSLIKDGNRIIDTELDEVLNV